MQLIYAGKNQAGRSKTTHLRADIAEAPLGQIHSPGDEFFLARVITGRRPRGYRSRDVGRRLLYYNYIQHGEPGPAVLFFREIPP